MKAAALVTAATSIEMICRIADLKVSVPPAGDLVSRCREYLCDEAYNPDINICTERFRPDVFPGMSEDLYTYMESGVHFYFQLLNFHGMMLHASAVHYKGRAYLFSAPCGTGKSTHTRIWKEIFGEEALIFNDDKPALRCIDGVWYAYGTPWCGKDGININMRSPIAGICFLKQAPDNKITRLSQVEASQRIIWQTLHKFKNAASIDKMLGLVNRLVSDIPVFELENRPEPEAAYLSYETMRQAAEEMGL